MINPFAEKKTFLKLHTTLLYWSVCRFEVKIKDQDLNETSLKIIAIANELSRSRSFEYIRSMPVIASVA